MERLLVGYLKFVSCIALVPLAMLLVLTGPSEEPDYFEDY